MWYTLGTWAWWLVLAALIGGVIGWLLRSVGVARRRDVATVQEEAAVLRNRAAELEQRNAMLERSLTEVVAQPATAPAAEPPAPTPAPMPPELLQEHAALLQKVNEQQHWIGELRVRLWNSEAKNRDLQAVVDSHVVAAAPPEPDLAEAARVLGQPVRVNDFTLVEGIGPAIAHLLVNRGVTTWWSLANADLSLLRSMLAEAGPKYQVHDPTSWPQQARLLANGDWVRFQRLVDALRGGYDAE